MRRTVNNPSLHRFAWLTLLVTLALIWMGGLVTSKGVGMAVPDWPTTFGYNMFLFPISKWVAGIREEHSHRLVASLVGFLTLILCGWLWLKEPRKWMRNLGFIAVVAVIFQGILGGVRVTLIKDEIGIFHACLAQAFLVLIGSIVLFTSPKWSAFGSANEISERATTPCRWRGLDIRWLMLGATLLIYLQLILGATMRHQHAGLAIPDFPLAYGKLWPDTDPDTIEYLNQSRMEVQHYNPITAAQIILQMIHRIMAVLIFIAVLLCLLASRSKAATAAGLFKGSIAWIVLVCMQAFLGAWTIWSNKAADVATAHVALGALTLLTGATMTMISFGGFSSALSLAESAGKKAVLTLSESDAEVTT